MRLQELAEKLGVEWRGNGDAEIQGAQSFLEAKKGDLTFAVTEKFLQKLSECQAEAIVVPKGVDLPKGKNYLLADHPLLVFGKAVEILYRPYLQPQVGISEKAILGKNVKLGEKVNLHPGCVISDNVTLGDRVSIYPGVFLGENVEVGDDTVIYPNVTVYRGTKIGKRVILHAGCVIGADGYRYVEVNGVHHKLPHIGRVVIEDDVEVGANTCIDRAMLGETRIGKGTKIDNLVQIGHNVQVGQGCLIVSQVGISGSVKLGKYVVLGGQAGLKDHIELGDGTKVAAQAGVTKSHPSQSVLLGAPAYPAEEAKRIFALTRMLPRMKEKLEKIERQLLLLLEGRS